MKVNNSVNSLISFFRWQRFEKWREIQISLEFRASEDNYIRQMILDIFLKYRSTMKINNSVNSVVFFRWQCFEKWREIQISLDIR